MQPTTRIRPAPLGLFADRTSPRLYDRIVEVLRVRHYSRRTEEAYIHWMRRYIEFHEHQLYEHVLEQPLDRIEGVVRARRPKRLPVVLTVDEVSRVMSHLRGDKWLIAMLPQAVIRPLQEHLRLVETIHQQDMADGYGRVELLGHNDVRTTMIYTHVLNRGGRGVRSPADVLARRPDER